MSAGKRERVERRLAAILAADVAGYSRLIGADEEGRHAALTALRREVSDPKIADHRGRIAKTTGDRLLGAVRPPPTRGRVPVSDVGKRAFASR